MSDEKPRNKWVGEGKIEKVYYEGPNIHEFALGIWEHKNGKNFNNWIRCSLPTIVMQQFALGDVIRVIGRADVRKIQPKAEGSKASYIQFMNCEQAFLKDPSDQGESNGEESQEDPPEQQEPATDNLGWKETKKKKKW